MEKYRKKLCDTFRLTNQPNICMDGQRNLEHPERKALTRSDGANHHTTVQQH